MTTPYTEPKVYSPKGWDAQVDYDLWDDTWVEKDKVIVHYGGNATFAGDPERAADKGYAWPSYAVERAVLRIYEQSHLSRGWRGLAYGWAVGQSGNVYRIRGWNRYGAHRGDLEPDGIPENDEGIPILCLIGGDQEPTAEMEQSLDWLIRFLGVSKGVDFKVYGHQEIAQIGEGTQTACPGVPLMEFVDAWVLTADLPKEEEETEMAYIDAQDILDVWDVEDLEHFQGLGWWQGAPDSARDYYKNPNASPHPDDVKTLVTDVLANAAVYASYEDQPPDVVELEQRVTAVEVDQEDLRSTLRSV